MNCNLIWSKLKKEDDQKSTSFEIEGVPVGGSAPCYLIAEMSGNHDGQIEEAIKIIYAAKEAGANAVKLQTYRADTITLNSLIIISGKIKITQKAHTLKYLPLMI